jgi:DUF438 domain-containing protein
MFLKYNLLTKKSTKMKTKNDLIIDAQGELIKVLKQENQYLKNILLSVQNLTSELIEDNADKLNRQECYSLVRDHINTLLKIYDLDLTEI